MRERDNAVSISSSTKARIQEEGSTTNAARGPGADSSSTRSAARQKFEYLTVLQNRFESKSDSSRRLPINSVGSYGTNARLRSGKIVDIVLWKYILILVVK